MGALLLFLVCAAVASVVLASATAAAGRVSGLAKSDQRYYSVASAAQLFRDELFGGNSEVEVTVERTKTTDSSGSATYSNKTTSTAESDSFGELFTEFAKQYVFGDASVADGTGTQAQYDRAPLEQHAAAEGEIVPESVRFVALEKTYSIDPDGKSGALKVKAKSRLEVDGSLLVRFYNVKSDGTEAKDTFDLYLKCTAQVDENDDADSSDLYEDPSEGSNQQTVKRTIITWIPTELSTRGA